MVRHNGQTPNRHDGTFGGYGKRVPLKYCRQHNLGLGERKDRADARCYRLIVARDRNRVRLITRGGHDWASRFPRT